jgi:hypothetical protein
MYVQTFATVLLAASVVSAAADPFGDLTKTGACFHRAYDAAHLKKNPRQLTTTMTVWIKSEAEDGRAGIGNFGLSVTRRGDSVPLFMSGGCQWGEDHSWMPSYKKKGGAGCVTSAVPDVFPDVSSAEEGGGVVFDPVPGGQTLMVHMDDSQSMVRRADRARKISVRFGPDDRVFLLRRADAQACAAVKDAITTMEPRKRPR